MLNQTPKQIIQTNRLLFIIGIIVFVCVIALFIYKSQAHLKVQASGKPRQSMDISPRAAEERWFNEEKFKNIKINLSGESRKPSTQETETKAVADQEMDLKKQEMEDEFSTRLEIQKMENKRQIEKKKLEFEALKSPLNLEVPPPPGMRKESKENQAVKGSQKDSLNEMLNIVKSLAGAKIPKIPSLESPSGVDANGQDGKMDFLKKENLEDDYLENTKKKARSPYEVKAGSYIPAALMTGINSDLPGNVNAQVTANVYDSITGNYLLIPQGARLVGEYNSNLTFGQKRVQVVWNRIIFPDGESLNLEKMQGVDQAGHSGFHDKVDNHYLRIYGNAVLLSLMGAGYDILNKNAEQSTDPRETVAASVGQKLADVSSQQIQKNMDVQPTLIISPGYKFKIFVMKDIVLENMEDVEGTLSYSK